ncbi:50S ribosomal protein L31 [Buchnera aphidicola (Anoecia corni)]|uniref:Large ribosomal subunit protein bL31 n=1 Tax=Buchnera aphidicola (Anoecia corni) TaxID=2994477 RepID=A0AAT9IHE2_9GAMM
MKKNVHPKYYKIVASCSCNNKIEIFSTINVDISLDVCSKCHPFYTGKQRVVDKKGRIDRFNKRFSLFSEGIK